MRRSHLAVGTALLSALAGVAANPITTATASADAGSAPTRSVIVRPVTDTGHAANGFHVKVQDHVTVDCSEQFASAGAVDPDIEECSPSAAYAIACWRSVIHHVTLCMRDPSSKRLYQLKLTRVFLGTRAPKPKDRAPLLMVLDDGTRCSIRDGGAWGQLTSHPRWVGSYSCTRHGVVWSPPHANHYGINESSPTWTVHIGPGVGKGTLTVRGIKRAYFVGTLAVPPHT